MRALKVVEQIAEPEISEAESWNGRLQMALLAPNGVQKLRELVLELAMRGKLVPQNHKDETAQKLLERISKEKGALLKNKKAKKLQSDFDEPYSVPDNWAWVHFSDIAQHNSGKTLDKGRNTGVLREYITTSNLYWGRFALENVREMPIKDSEIEKCTARKNDLLICEGGEAGRAAVWHYDREVCFQNHVHRARFYCDVNPYFLYRFFEKINATGEINAYRKGVAISNMSGKSLGSIILPLPPINEQGRIVEKIDELMALCDKLEAQKADAADAHETLVKILLGTLTQSQSAREFQENWQRIAKNFNILFTTEASIDALKKTILQLAIMGKLASQNLKDESANKLLELIKAEKNKSGKAEKNAKKRSNFIAKETDDIFDIPQNWTWTTLSEISTLITDGEHLTPERTPDTTQIPLATAKNVRDGYLDLSNTDFVPKSVAQKCWKRCKPEKGDILIVSVGATTGRLSVCRESIDMVIVRSVTIIRPCLVDVDFLALTLNTPHLQKLIWKGVKQNAQPCLYLSASKNLSIPLPPLAEQKRIVCKVKELMDFCDNLKDGLVKFNTAHEHLATALVEKAVAA